MNILFIDNFDSFTYNLVQYFLKLNTNIKVFRNNTLNIDSNIDWADKIVISPGPKAPKDAGITKYVIEKYKGIKPILGVCLGMQAINEVYGGITDYAPMPVHGKVSKIINNNKGLFKGLPSSFLVARYHSLMVKIKNGLSLDAWTEDMVPMAISDIENNVFGLQFHPESFLSEYGLNLLNNFLQI